MSVKYSKHSKYARNRLPETMPGIVTLNPRTVLHIYMYDADCNLPQTFILIVCLISILFSSFALASADHRKGR